MEAYSNKLYDNLLAKVQRGSCKKGYDDFIHSRLPWPHHRASFKVVVDHDREE